VPSFTDTTGRDWRVALDVTTVKTVRDRAEVDLADLEQAPKTFAQLADDPVLLVDVLYLVCQSEASDRDVSPEDFGRSLAGDAIEHATAALEEAICDFFPRGKRSLLQRLRKKLDQVREKTVDLIETNLQDPEIDEAINQAVKDQMDRERAAYLTRLRSAMSSPDLSEESIPVH